MPNNYPSVSVILLNYNSSKPTINFIEKHENIDKITNIVVVDNASTDDSYTEIQTYLTSNEDFQSKVSLISSDLNGGYAKGNNFGIKYALAHFSSDLIIVANPDVVFSDETLNKMLDFYEYAESQGLSLGAFAPSLHDDFKVNQTTSWKQPTPKTDCIAALLVTGKLSKILNKHFSKRQKPAKYQPVEVIHGSFFAIPSGTITDIDFLDENTFLYCEERILAARLKNKGYQSFELTNCSYDHIGAASINRSVSSINKFKILYASRFYYLTHYFNLSLAKSSLIKLFFNFGLLERKILLSVAKK